MKKVYCKNCKKYDVSTENCKVVRNNYYAPDAIVYEDPMIKNRLNSCRDFESKDKEIICPCCEKYWNITTHNACQCGAIINNRVA